MARTKFNVDKNVASRTYDGIVFDSNVEMRFYKEIVCEKMKTGEIISFQLQKEYILQPSFVHLGKKIQPIKYVADFFIVYKDGHEQVVDTKGYPDSVALIKRKMFWYTFPEIDYIWMKWVKKFGGWIEYEQYKELKRKEKKAKKDKAKEQEAKNK